MYVNMFPKQMSNVLVLYCTGGYTQNGTLFSNCCGGREKGFPYKKTCAADGFGRFISFPAIGNSVYGLLVGFIPSSLYFLET